MAADSKKTIAFRVPEPLRERINEFADENNMSQSDTLRELVRTGLDAEEIKENVEQLEARVEELEQQRGDEGQSFLSRFR